MKAAQNMTGQIDRASHFNLDRRRFLQSSAVAGVAGGLVQAALPDSMYVFPVDPSVALPKQWASFAQQPTDPYEVDPAQVSEHRDEWLREWSDVTSR